MDMVVAVGLELMVVVGLMLVVVEGMLVGAEEMDGSIDDTLEGASVVGVVGTGDGESSILNP